MRNLYALSWLYLLLDVSDVAISDIFFLGNNIAKESYLYALNDFKKR